MRNCNENDPPVNAGSTEITYNGKDDDCNPNTLDDDLNQDGSNLNDDCDDTDPAVNSSAEEICNNGLDDDCDGSVDENCIAVQIGNFREGGIVFWIDPTDKSHGLVCAVLDQGESVWWYNGSFFTTGATGTAIGTGTTNTDVIIAMQGAPETSYAAGLARAYTGGGFYDWFLPSRGELMAMYDNKATIDATATANGGAVFDWYYWSSTEYDDTRAWGIISTTLVLRATT